MSMIRKYEEHPGEESIHYYMPGGYHPVHVGDTFCDGTYEVMNKLGWGQYSTVWLVKDRKRGQYASMKILAAEVSCSTSEVDVMRYIQRNSSTLAGKEFVVHLIDEFKHTGPNGVHRCIVTEVLGPPLSSDIEDLYPNESYPISISKRMVSQIARGLEYLHHYGVIHGDLHLGNILFHSPSIASWSSQEEVDQYLRPPRFSTVTRLSSDDSSPLSPHVPAYVVVTPNPDPLLKLCLSDPSQVYIKICDFSESLIYKPETYRKVHTALVYSAPEILLDDVPSCASDVWSLAVLIQHLVSDGLCLFRFGQITPNYVLARSVNLLGKLPERWWLKWADRGQYFDDDDCLVADPRNFSVIAQGTRVDEQEKVSLELMLRKMFAHEPSERATMTEIVQLILETWSL